MTEQEKKQVIKEYFSNMGKKTASKMTKEQRKTRASKAGKARWAKGKNKVINN